MAQICAYVARIRTYQDLWQRFYEKHNPCRSKTLTIVIITGKSHGSVCLQSCNLDVWMGRGKIPLFAHKINRCNECVQICLTQYLWFLFSGSMVETVTHWMQCYSCSATGHVEQEAETMTHMIQANRTSYQSILLLCLLFLVVFFKINLHPGNRFDLNLASLLSNKQNFCVSFTTIVGSIY